MSVIYKTSLVEITYDAQDNRAYLDKSNFLNSASVALILKKADLSCWDSFKMFIFKHFTWTWISVKSAQGKKTDQWININSIVKNIGLTPKEIKKANKSGRLYQAMEQRLRDKDMPGPSELGDLISKDLVAKRAFIIDESSEAAFLQTFNDCCNQLPYPSPTPQVDLSVILASYAITHHHYIDMAMDWVRSEMEDGEVKSRAIQTLFDLAS